jgi:hypothetical protein
LGEHLCAAGQRLGEGAEIVVEQTAQIEFSIDCFVF